MLDKEFAENFAREWIEAFNSHDLGRIFSLYDDEFTMTSPYIRERMDTELPLKQKGAATDHRLQWSFATVHEHDCGDDCAVDHIGCNLYHT